MAGGANPWKVIDVLKWGKNYFDEKGIDSPRLSIELMLCKVLNCHRIDLYSGFERFLTESELASLKEYVKRRIKHEPLQYITGSSNFMGMEIHVEPGVLIPRPETEQMVSVIIDYYKNIHPKRILDIGTGSGCIAVALAKAFPGSFIYGIDNSPQAIDIARQNADENKVSNIQFDICDVLKNPLSIPYIDSKRYDLVVSNPPYIDKAEHGVLDPEVRIYEPAGALTDFGDGFTFYRWFAEIFRDLLTEKGEFFIEIGWGQMSEVKEIFVRNDFDIAAIKDFGGIPRIITNCRKFF
jgi:release factor glutamine methyltransferase